MTSAIRKGVQLVYQRKDYKKDLLGMLESYKKSSVKRIRVHKRPVVILTIPMAEAHFMPGGNVAVFLPEFSRGYGHFNGGKKVLEILDMKGNLITRNYGTCPACYRLAGEVKKKRSGGYAERCEGTRIIHIFQCKHCTHEWELVH